VLGPLDYSDTEFPNVCSLRFDGVDDVLESSQTITIGQNIPLHHITSFKITGVNEISGGVTIAGTSGASTHWFRHLVRSQIGVECMYSYNLRTGGSVIGANSSIFGINMPVISQTSWNNGDLSFNLFKEG